VAESQAGRRPVRRAWTVGVGILVVAAVGGGIALWATAASGSTGYRTAMATTASVEQTLTLSGTAAPVDQATAAFQVAGTVAAVDVAVGQSVTAGETLASLDTTTLQQAVTSAQTNLDAAKARLAEDEAAQAAATTTTTTTTTTAPTTTTTTASTTTTTPSGTSGSAEGALQQAQQAVVAAQQAADAAAQQATTALAAVQTACGQASTSPATSPASTTTTTTTPSPTSSSCRSALTSAQAAQQQVATAQKAVATAEGHLAQVLAASGSGSPSGSGGTGSGAKGPATTSPGSGSSANGSPANGSPGTTSGGTGTGTGTGTGGTTTTTRPASGTSPHGTTSTKGATTGGNGSAGGVPTAAQVAADQASVDTATASVIEAQQNLASAQLTTPVAGTVVSVDLAVGRAVAAGSSTDVVTVISAGTFEVTASVTSTEAAEMKVGDTADVTVNGLATALVGTVSRIGPPDTGGSSITYPVVVALPAGVHGIRAGSSAQAEVVLDRAKGALVVPTSAVHTDGAGDAYVTVLRDGQPVRRPVTVGIVGGVYTQITKGLAGRSTVVLADRSVPLPSSNSTGGGTGGPFGSSGPGGTRIFISPAARVGAP